MAPEPVQVMRAAAMAAAGLLAGFGLRSEIIDRVVAIVGTEAVTLSEVRAELGLEAMFAEAEVEDFSKGSDAALGRLIDRRLIMQDMTLTPFLMPATEEIESELSNLRADRYLGDRDFAAALSHYGLTESDCRSFLEQRIAFERYVSFRFKTGLSAGRSEIEAYYRDEYLPGIRLRDGQPAPLEQVAEEVSEVIVERRASELLELRLLELRSINRIETMLAPKGESEP